MAKMVKMAKMGRRAKFSHLNYLNQINHIVYSPPGGRDTPCIRPLAHPGWRLLFAAHVAVFLQAGEAASG